MAHSDASYELATSSLWLVAMISPTNSALSCIGQLLKAIEPFMHPSNHGWFQRLLHGAISKLCSLFTARVKLERFVTTDLSSPSRMIVFDLTFLS